MINKQGLDKVCHVLAADSNEGKATAARPASWRTREMRATEIPIHLYALVVGSIPPFFPFFNAVMSHYKIHLLHLYPHSIILLAVFAFLCEAMVGIAPSVALFSHFFSLHLVDACRCSGCVASSGIDFELSPVVSGLRKRWVFVDAGVLSSCFHECQPNPAPAGGT